MKVKSTLVEALKFYADRYRAPDSRGDKARAALVQLERAEVWWRDPTGMRAVLRVAPPRPDDGVAERVLVIPDPEPTQ